jgi:subtilisin family serine protease
LRQLARYAALTSAALLPLLFFCLFCAATADAEDGPKAVTAVFTVPGIESPRGGAEYLAPVAQQAIQATADAILASLAPEDFVLTHRFQAINAIAGIATPAGMSALAAHPNVVAVDVQEDGEFFLAEAIPLASMPAVNTVSGGIIDGSGITVAVIDSGVDATHPDLSGSIVGEACFCAGGCCPNGMATQTGAGSAADSVGHGTEVAGVITSAGGIAPRGGAPGASIVAIGLAGTTGLDTFTPADLTAALDHVIMSLPDVDIVNLSLGLTATYATDCDGADATTMAWASAIDTLAARGTVAIAASGNDAIGTGITPPACIANAISVGATYDAPQAFVSFPSCSDFDTVIDDVTCFTNSASLLDLVAPGGEITTTGLWPSPGTTSVFA